MYETCCHGAGGRRHHSIPMQSDVSVMYARLDLIEEVNGERAAPTTLDELEQVATEVNSPPMVSGIGLTVGRTPDAHGQIVQMILNEGGTLVDESGAPTIDNPGTVAALERMKRWWDNGLIPENSPSWDDAGNNTAYNSGQAAFVFNPARSLPTWKRTILICWQTPLRRRSQPGRRGTSRRWAPGRGQFRLIARISMQPSR